ncbi:protein-L-isoaspartate(D-aspartate) O-methyltransferase (PCMT) [Allonocardiopsis opalescens]|uniref:Protein-L-isoaspartate O-methyltransferase n=1 Tax=Allonocardiopsis opalescens TaxID=1144618 RepID=A0A2T0Q9W1_9ACTN|nr:protein-L-isoaspartate(D-aspartate) O-methyltransferase (PCMT) [Allonocardiopsis opalescens]
MAGDDWRTHAEWLAGKLAEPRSRWWAPIAATPRHLLVPRWWQRGGGSWSLREGADDAEAWMHAAYRRTTSLVTQVGPLHADHASPGDRPEGRPASSSTNPWLVMQMYRFARIHPGHDVLDVATGSGYGCALLARLLGDAHVTSVDIDPYLVKAAGRRLDALGLRPVLLTADATGPLPGGYDRIVSMVGMPGVPASWLPALRPGGRLVTTLAGAPITITATKDDDGGAWGKVEHATAGFMAARSGPDHPADTPLPADTAEGENVRTGRYPVIDLDRSPELAATLFLAAPGIHHGYDEDADGVRTAWMVHADGSWARATGRRGERPVVHQSGPRRLWELLDGIRHDWVADGYLQVYGATVRIDPDGTAHFARGRWRATLPPAG